MAVERMYVVVRAKDGKRFSIPADHYRTEGIVLYLLGTTDDTYNIVEVDPVAPEYTAEAAAVVRDVLAAIQ